MKISQLSHLLLCTKTCSRDEPGVLFYPHAKFSLQSIKFLLRYAMGIMFGMFSFAFWVFITQKCEVAIFPKFKSGCMHARPLGYLDTPYSFREHTPCMCIHIVHAKCNITRFANDVNHVIMMSLVFAFHSCQVGMRWHDIIGVHDS